MLRRGLIGFWDSVLAGHAGIDVPVWLIGDYNVSGSWGVGFSRRVARHGSPGFVEVRTAMAMPTTVTKTYPCPCCGYEVFSEPAGSYEICPICFWEDDLVQLAFPDLAGGANKCSLIDGQRNYGQLGACELRLSPHVRLPQRGEKQTAGWRAIDPDRDRYLRWANRADHVLWNSVKNAQDRCDYYWLKEYWLAQRQA